MPRDLLTEKKRAPRDLLAGKPKTDRDRYYSSGIYAGENNPLGPIARTLDAGARGIQSGASFNFDDELGLSTNAEKEALRKESPIAFTIGEIAGGLGLGGAAVKGGLSLLKGAKPTLMSLMGRGAGEGATYGALYGLGDGEGMEDRLNRAGYGAATGATAGAAGGALARVGAGRVSVSQAPTVEQLKSAANRAYQQADDAGVMFRPHGLRRISRDITANLAEFGYHPKLQPRIATALDELERISTGNVTLKGLEQFRKIANNARISNDSSERMIGGEIIDALDNFVLNTQPGEVLVGNAQHGGEALKRARALWHRASKAKTIETTFENARLDAAASASGGNLENTARQGIKQILKSPSRSRGFTPAEKSAMEQYVNGQKLARQIGRLSPHGNGLMAALSIGGTVANPLLAMVPAAGYAAKTIATRGSRANRELLEAMVRSGGRVAAPQLSGSRKALVDAMVRSGVVAAP